MDADTRRMLQQIETAKREAQRLVTQLDQVAKTLVRAGGSGGGNRPTGATHPLRRGTSATAVVRRNLPVRPSEMQRNLEIQQAMSGLDDAANLISQARKRLETTTRQSPYRG